MNRLRSYRAIEGLNQQELGELLGISPQMVSAIESGRRSLSSSLELLGYADERLTIPDMSTPLHRHRASTRQAAKDRAQELLRLAGEVFGELVEMTDRAPRPALERLEAPTNPDELEELALEVRCLLRQEEHGPIRDLTLAVEQAGVCLIPIVGLAGIDGLSAWVQGIPVIGISPSVPGDRFRLTVGHELAHLQFHTRSTATTESEANRFAGALLFPHADFDAAMPQRPQLRDFVALKSSWGVSVAALVYRAHELEYINDQRYRAVQIQMSKWRRSEPGEFAPRHGQLVSRLVEVNGGAVAVAGQLGVNRAHLAELTNWSPLRVAGLQSVGSGER